MSADAGPAELAAKYDRIAEKYAAALFEPDEMRGFLESAGLATATKR